MNPNHAACFNELKELCRKYRLDIYASGERVLFCLDSRRDATYCSHNFHQATGSVTHIIDTDIQPPEAKGEKGND